MLSQAHGVSLGELDSLCVPAKLEYSVTLQFMIVFYFETMYELAII